MLENNKYINTILLAMRTQLMRRNQLIGRGVLYATVVYLFFQVFQSVGAPSARVWYLAITEWLILSTATTAHEISQDIQSGQIIYFLLRPFDYLLLKLTESVGVIFVRFFLLFCICIGLSYALTGYCPCELSSWIAGMIFGLLGIFLYTLIMMLIGICSFWFREIQPFIYLNVTATFCFGGLIVPLEYYPESVKTISFATPYAWILWWPAQTITGQGPPLWKGFLNYGMWVIIITSLILILYRRCLKSFAGEGG